MYRKDGKEYLLLLECFIYGYYILGNNEIVFDSFYGIW